MDIRRHLLLLLDTIIALLCFEKCGYLVILDYLVCSQHGDKLLTTTLLLSDYYPIILYRFS